MRGTKSMWCSDGDHAPACKYATDWHKELNKKLGAALDAFDKQRQGGTHMTTKKKKQELANDLTQLAAARRERIDSNWVSPEERKRAEERKAKEQAQYEAEVKEGFDAALAARDRFAAEPDAKFAFHLHHEVFYEKIKGDSGVSGLAGANERIDFVVTTKPLDELVARLRVMRPIPNDRLPEPIDLQAAIKAATEDQERKYQTYVATLNSRDGTVGKLQAAYDNLRYANDPSLHRDSVIAAIDAYIESKSTSVDNVKKAEAEYLAADNEYRRLSSLRRDEKVFAEADMYALHKELCEADCPWTEDHKSVIPERK